MSRLQESSSRYSEQVAALAVALERVNSRNARHFGRTVFMVVILSFA
jgi:hypothetical protein